MKKSQKVKKADKFEFIESEHKYLLNGKRLRSVSEILKESGIVDDAFYTEEGAIRGRYIHEACHLFDNENLNWDTLDPILLPYVEAYKNFRESTKGKIEIIESETPRYHELYRYAGTPDRVIKLKTPHGRVWGLIDLKTGAKAKWHGLQLAAYAGLIKDFPFLKVFVLRLTNKGKFFLEKVKTDIQYDFAVFIGAYNVINWKVINGIIDEERPRKKRT